SDDAAGRVRDAAEGYRGRVVEVQVVPNTGRDIGPFLNAFGNRLSTGYEFVGHIHTKKSVNLNDDSVGRTWFHFLMENLLSHKHPMMDIILAKMASDPSIKMVYPNDPNILSWSKNYNLRMKLAARLGMRSPIATQFSFPVGT